MASLHAIYAVLDGLLAVIDGLGWENDPGLLEMTKPRHLEVAA